MWWKQVCSYLGKNYCNSSWSGSMVTGTPKGSAYTACSDARVQDAGRNGEPSVIICYAGINDFARDVELGTWSSGDPVIDDSSFLPTDTVDTFREAYALMLSKLKGAYPDSRIICLTLLEKTGTVNGRGNTLAEWNTAISEVASAFEADVIDIHDCGITQENLDEYTYDESGIHVHPNADGQELIANYIIHLI